MQDLVVDVFELSLSPFTSGSFLVWLPVLFSFCLGCVFLVFSLMGRR